MTTAASRLLRPIAAVAAASLPFVPVTVSRPETSEPIAPAAPAGAAEVPAAVRPPAATSLPEAFRNAAAVALDESVTATLHEGGRTLRIERKILLLSRAGFDQADREIDYDSERSVLKRFSARTRKPDGQTVEVPQELQRDSVLFRSGSREWHVLQFTFTAIEPNSVIEWEYELEEKEADRLDWWEVQRDIPVLRAGYRVRWPVREDDRHAADFYSRVQRSNWCSENSRVYEGMQEKELVCRGLPAFETESAAPPENDIRLRVLVALESSPNIQRPLHQRLWVGADHWWSQRIEAFLAKRDAVRERARRIAFGATSVRQRIDRVMRWAQENLRVRDDSFATGALQEVKGQPPTADVVLERLGGTSEEVTLLTMALLQDAGVSARAVLVGDQSRQRADFAFPDLAQVAQMLIQVGWDQGEWGFIDATCRFCQPGIPDWRYCTGTKSALLVGDFAAPVLLNSVELSPEGSVERWKQRITVQPDGSAAIEGIVAWTGHQDVELRERWDGMTVEGRREDFIQRLGGAVEPLSVEPSSPEDRGSYLHVAYQYRRADAALRTEDLLLLRPIDVFTDQLGIPIQEKRRTPLQADYARTVGAESVFVIPRGFSMPALPQGANASGPGFRFDFQWTPGEAEREIVWRGRLLVDARPIEAAEYERVAAFDQDLRALLRTPLVLEREPAPEERSGQ